MRFKFRPIFKDISLTFIVEVIVLIAFFSIYRLIAKNFGPEGVGKYSLVKRIIGFLYPLLLLGLGIGIPRYIAMSRDKNQRSSYIKTGGLVIAAFTFIALIFINLFKGHFAKIFFGNLNYINLVLPFSLFLAGMVLHTLVYSYFRGRLMVRIFNLLQVVNLSLVPLGILIFFKTLPLETVITLIGIATIIIAFIFSLFFIKEFFIHIKKWQFLNSLKELFHYSLPRVPGDFVMAGLLSLGPIFAVHFATIKEVGYLSVSQSLLGLTGAIFIPLSIILFPKVSNLIIQGRNETIQENVNFLIAAIFQCFIFLCIQFIIFTDVIIKYWLGLEFFGAIPVMRIVFLSIIFYVFFKSMGSVLDAAKVKPINTINISISLGVFIFLSGMLLLLFKSLAPIISLSIAFTCGIICSGVLTYLSIRKIYPEKFKKDLNYFLIAIGINILLGGATILVKPLIASSLYYLVIFEIFLGSIYLLSLWLLKIEWIRQIPKKIFSTSRSII